MKDVDGFTLIDYIKSSVEILMNMKIEENDNSSSIIKTKKKRREKEGGEERGNQETIRGVDIHTVTSSLRDL